MQTKVFKKCLLISLVFMASAVFAATSQDNTQINNSTAINQNNIVPADGGLSLTEKYYRYGDVLFNKADYTNAVKYFYAVTKAEPKNVKAWKKMAFCYYKLNNHNYAYRVFKIVLKYDSKDKDALEFMDYYKNIIEKRTSVKVVREPFDSIWRAAILPSWGQFYNNQIAKGFIDGSIFIVAASLAIYNVNDEKTKYEKYSRTNENQDIAYTQAKESWTSALMWGIIAGVVYAGGIVDAGLNYNCDEVRLANIEIKDNAVFVKVSYAW